MTFIISSALMPLSTINAQSLSIVDKGISAEEIMNVMKHEAGRLLQNISVFDIYEGELIPGKSIAFRLTFADATRTLTDEEVMNIFNRVIKKVEETFKAKLRDK